MLISAGGGAATAGRAEAPAGTFELPRLPGEGEQLILSHGGERLAIRRPPPARAALPPLPVGSDFLTEAAPVTFGEEERCTVRKRGPGLELACAPGRTAAGLLLKLNARYPRGAAISGRIEAEGDAGFLAQFGHAGDDAAAAREVLGGAPFPLPARKISEPAQLAILAPLSGGTLRIGSVSLVPVKATSNTPRAAAWAWEPELWQQQGDNLLRAAASRGLHRLIVTLAIANGRIEDPAALARFVAAAGQRGIAVEAVEGDPDMVFEEGLAAAQVRARAIAAYQRSAPPEARLAAVQYDIEPYALAVWGRHPADYRGWSNAVRTLSRALGAPIHLVLPFWLAEEEEGPAFLEAIAPSISGITIMAYRTDAGAVSRIAEPLLTWGGAAGKRVRVALEAGPVGDEAEERFISAPRGRIAVARVGGKVTATLLSEEEAVPGSVMFASTGRTRTPPERMSFLGAEQRMRETAEALAAPLASWPAFDGFAYHGLAWRR
jgi:hypothetical protein